MNIKGHTFPFTCKNLKLGNCFKTLFSSARFGSTYTKIGTVQRRLAWPLRKDDTQICEAFHIFKKTLFS